MNDSFKTTIVRILGDDYPIKSDADPEYLQELAKYVEQKILGISTKNRLPSNLKSEVLAAILIADEYFNEKKKNVSIEQKISDLNNLLEENITTAESQN